MPAASRPPVPPQSAACTRATSVTSGTYSPPPEGWAGILVDIAPVLLVPSPVWGPLAQTLFERVLDSHRVWEPPKWTQLRCPRGYTAMGKPARLKLGLPGRHLTGSWCRPAPLQPSRTGRRGKGQQLALPHFLGESLPGPGPPVPTPCPAGTPTSTSFLRQGGGGDLACPDSIIPLNAFPPPCQLRSNVCL